MDHLVALGDKARTAAGRSLARVRCRAPVGRWASSPRVIGVTIGLVTWWLLIAGALALLMPAPAESAPKAGLIVAPGQTGRIRQPGMPDWPIPVDRLAYDEYQRGFREGDEDAMDHAFSAFEWIKVLDRQAVRIVDVDGDAVQIEVLEGQNVGRRGWLKRRNLGP